jgi:hypothetical protein
MLRSAESAKRHFRVRTALNFVMRRYVPIALMLIATVPLSQAGTTQGATKRPSGARCGCPTGARPSRAIGDLGVRFLQLSLNWAATAPQRPANPRDPSDLAYHWPRDLDEAVGQARRSPAGWHPRLGT